MTRRDPSLLVVLYEQNESTPVDKSIACALDTLTAMHTAFLFVPLSSGMCVCARESAEDQAAAAPSPSLPRAFLLLATTTTTRQDEQISRSSSSEYVSDGEHSKG